MGSGRQRRTWYVEYLKQQRRRRIKIAAGIGVAGVVVVATVLVAGNAGDTPDVAQQAPVASASAFAKLEAEEPKGTVAVVGDSYSLGSGKTWPNRLAACLSYDLVLSGVGGSGFHAAGSGAPFGDAERVSKVAEGEPDLIVLETAYNDSWHAEWNPQGVTDAAVKTIEAYRDAAPDAELIMLGPFWTQGEQTDAIKQNLGALKAASEATDVPLMEALDWLGEDAVLDDGLHPNMVGHKVITDNLVPALVDAGLVESSCP